jgi:3-hydroxyisobutyrate dehydrogenase
LPAPGAGLSRIAFLGLGTMGGRMARHLIDEHDLVVWNRSPEKTTGFADVAATPAEAVQVADFVITMVSDANALAAVTDGLATDAPLIQMSTVGGPALERLATTYPGEVLDAPVLGSTPEAEAGTLTIFAGGSPELVERARPLLSLLGSVVHVGPLGAGTAAKLVANASLFAVLGALGEALAFAEGLGLSPETAFEVLARTPLAAQAERRRPAVERGEYATRFALSLALKDQNLVLDAAEGADVDLRVAPAVRAWLADAERAGRGRQDYSAVLAEIISRG